MRFIEKPERVDLQIQREMQRVSKRKRRLFVTRLNPGESRIFWEDLIEAGQVSGDPASDADFATFVALGDYDYFGVRVKLNIDGA